MPFDVLYQNYLELKRIAPDCVVFVPNTDYFETFGNDAILVSKLLNLPLTHVKLSEIEQIPVVGVSYPHFDRSLADLICKGVQTLQSPVVI